MSDRTLDAHAHSFCRHLPFGAQPIGNTRAKFRLWAPTQKTIHLDIAGQATREMTPSKDGWFELETECQLGDHYRYMLASGQTVPDPASRFQPDGVHGFSEVVCPTQYAWQHPEWAGLPWENTVLYELHVGALGGYQGVMAKLAALRELGVTAIELMPLNSFPGDRNWGYDGVLPFAPSASYGRPDDLKALIDTAHGLGMMVFLDVVYNHFGPDGNFLHAYAEPFFKAGTHTPWGPAIDFDKPEVRTYFFENALYWLMEYRFDGLRLDAVHAIDNDGWLRELSERVKASVEPGRHVHLVLENERNSSNLLEQHFNAQWSDDAHNTMHVLLTGETESYYEAFATRPLKLLARILAEGFAYQGEASPIHDGAPRGEPSGALAPSAFVFFLQNHDQIGNRAMGERLRSLTDDARLRAATALMLLSPQIPMLFMGEEVGSTDPFFFFTGYTGDLADAVREGRRKEFAKFAAFNDPARREEIPDPNALTTFERSRPALDAHSDDANEWRTFYRTLLTLRHRHIVPGLHDGIRSEGARVFYRSETQPENSDGGVVASWRLSNGRRLTIAINFSDAEVLAVPLADEVLFAVPKQASANGTSGTLAPCSCIITLSAPTASTHTHEAH